MVLILSITGCLYAFVDEITPLIYRQRQRVVPGSHAMVPLDRLRETAEKAIGHPANQVFIPNRPDAAVRFIAYRFDADAWHYGAQYPYYYTCYIDPYTAGVMYMENTKYEFFNLVFHLHFDLLLAGAGRWIVGWSTVVFAVLLATGLVLWWPHKRSALRQRIRFVWTDRTRWKRKNYDLHNILGFYTLVPALVLALTGLVWAFPQVDHTVQRLLDGGERPSGTVTVTDNRLPGPEGPLERIVRDLWADMPGARYYLLNLPDAGTGAPVTGLAYPYGRQRYQYTLNTYEATDGRKLSGHRYIDKSPGAKYRAMNYDIHIGNIFGLPGKILAFGISLICASLPVTGAVIWWQGRKKKRTRAS